MWLFNMELGDLLLGIAGGAVTAHVIANITDYCEMRWKLYRTQTKKNAPRINELAQGAQQELYDNSLTRIQLWGYRLAIKHHIESQSSQ